MNILADSACMHAKSLQSCPTLCSSMDCSLPGSSIHGVFHARILEWVAFPSPGALPNPGTNLHLLFLLHWQADSIPLDCLLNCICSCSDIF